MTAKFKANGWAVHPWHHPIEQGKTRCVRAYQLLQRLAAIFRQDDFITGPAQDSFHHAAGDGIVICHENPHWIVSWQSCSSDSIVLANSFSRLSRAALADARSPDTPRRSRLAAISLASVAARLERAPLSAWLACLTPVASLRWIAW